MTIADGINATFETTGGIFMLANCIRVHKDKQVKGISLVSAMFFCTWGYWNMFYYPSLSQPLSTIGAIIMAFFNTVWISQALYYTYINKHKKP